MNVNVTIYGYTYSGAAYHPDCLPATVNPATNDEVGALFSYHSEEWAEGLGCDGCTEYIFEPIEAPELGEPELGEDMPDVPEAWVTLREFWHDMPASSR